MLADFYYVIHKVHNVVFLNHSFMVLGQQTKVLQPVFIWSFWVFSCNQKVCQLAGLPIKVLMLHKLRMIKFISKMEKFQVPIFIGEKLLELFW